MDTLSVTFIVVAVVSCSIWAWTFTKSGKKWIKNLQYPDVIFTVGAATAGNFPERPDIRHGKRQRV